MRWVWGRPFKQVCDIISPVLSFQTFGSFRIDSKLTWDALVSLIALLREKENYLGPHLIVAPLSTLSNWEAEFEKWTPSVPVVLYHGTPKERKTLRDTRMFKNLPGGRPNLKFPVVLTSPEIVIRDENDLSKINWEMIIIVGHQLLLKTALCSYDYRMKVIA